MKNSAHRLRAGFTLVEVMVTVAVVGVLLAIALPSYDNFVKNTCLTTNTNMLVTSLQLARSEALSGTEDVAALTNVIHSLYSMRWHRGVINLLDDMWERNTRKYPGLAWDALDRIPARIALASTINRIRIYQTETYREFIRTHKYDDHEFHRAQVVIALGLNGDPEDVDYVKEMADGDNVYVAQTAITALGLMVHPRARDALVDLSRKYRNDNDRGRLIREVFTRAYVRQ